MKLFRITILILAACLSWSVWANDGWQRPFTLLGPNQGLPAGGINALTQDEDGFIWLGTGSGLLRYEGAQCSRWTRKEGLPSDTIDQVRAIPGGGLWLSTAVGLVRFRNGRFEPAQFESLTTFPVLYAMAMDASGRLWAATSKGLFIQTQEVQFRLHPQSPSGSIHTVVSGRAGSMHVGSATGLFTYRADGTVEAWNATHGLPRNGVELVGEEGSGRLWVCTGRMLVAKEPGTSVFKDQSSLLKSPVTPYGFFYKDRDGSLWLPTRVGALHLDGGRTKLLDDSEGLPIRWVRNVFRDREGGFWILGPTLVRLLGNDRLWNHPLTKGPLGGLVWSMTRDPKGDLLVGTDDGVVRLGDSGARRIPGTEGQRLKSISVDRTGRTWMVGTLGAIHWLRPGRGRAEVPPLGDLGVGLNTVMTDSKGQVWLGHGRLGILRWDDSRGRLLQAKGPEDAPSGNLGVFQIREDSKGRLWVATSLGLYLRDPSGTWRLFTEKDGILPYGLHGMAFLPDGSAWIHSREPQGLMRIRIEGDRVAVLDWRRAGQGFQSNLIYAVEVDPQGRTWVATDQGFDCLDTQLHVGRREGMASEDCDLLGLLTEKGRVWVGTAAGLVRYEVGEGDPQVAPPRPHILQVQNGDQRLEAPIEAFGPVGPREPNLAFRVAVPSYQYEGQVRIQVRLVGLDDAWRDLDAPLARYPALPGGSYRFEARAAQPNGDFTSVVSLSFRVRPPWWQSWWALGLWGLCAAGLVFAIVRVRVAALAQSKIMLEALVAERTEELRHRNEELTGALGQVKQLSGLLPICATCKKIRDDKGYWNQLEQYISDHTDVGFSHGICPDCTHTLFPDYAARKAARNRSEP